MDTINQSLKFMGIRFFTANGSDVTPINWFGRLLCEMAVRQGQFTTQDRVVYSLKKLN